MRRRLFTIAPHGKFLEVLADRVLDGALLNGWDRTAPFWLSDITIILPTRRARLALAEIFAERLGGAALLPDIRALGGEDPDDTPFLPVAAGPPTLPEASRLERRLTLSRLVRQFAEHAGGFASPPNAAEVFWLADSLGTLIDDLTIEDVPASRLDTLVPEELSARWADILKVLGPALEGWPKVLAERGKIDPAMARNGRLLRQAETAAASFGNHPVIAAGSTGSIPATATLLGAIADLPRGTIVLPGLDTTLSPTQHQLLLDDDTLRGHPQYGLARLLRRLGAGVPEVEELAGSSPRTTLLRAALAPAEATIGWSAMRAAVDLGDALGGVSVIAAPTADLEARAIALAARQAVVDGRTVGIVSRDQTLARRIAAELGRHGIAVDDPAGTPLYQSGAGRLARQVLAVATERFAPVPLIALLRNAAVLLGRERADVQRLTTRIDLKLRRDRAASGVDGLRELLADDDLRALIDALDAALAPVSEIAKASATHAAALAAALEAAISGLIDGRYLPGLVEFRGWVAELAASGAPGAEFAPVNLDGVLKALMEGVRVAPGERRRDDVHIWGELEARLMNPDVLFLAGLNEGIWPAPADPGPWMSRKMRLEIGLEPPERQQGLAAHDFEMALGNAEVILAFANRIGTAPALPSRFVQRIDALVGSGHAKELRARGAVWLDQAEAIDFAGLPTPAKAPSPSPSAELRPRKLSVTEVETLMRSPYDIYARHVLKLRRLEPLGTEPSARERGTMIHEVFERFVLEGASFAAPDAGERLLAMANEAFRNLDAIAERRDIWITRFKHSAAEFLSFERSRHAGIASRAAEIRGEWRFPALENFVLVGKADRIDQRTDGLLEILDFKTGGVPAPKDMTGFEAPQLLLEAAMARAGAFAEIAPRDTAALIYIKIGLGPRSFVLRPFSLRKGMRLMDAVDEMERRFQGHVEAFLIRGDLPMVARLKPREQTGRKQRPGEYDHLARMDEWTLVSGVDDP